MGNYLVKSRRGDYLPRQRQSCSLCRLLDEVVEQLRRRIVHFDVKVLDAAGQVVVKPDGRNGHDQAERRFDERFGNTGRDGTQAAGTGISEALVETALGLVVAIPAVWFYNYLTGRIEYFNVEMDNSSSELLDYFIKKTA